LNILTVNILSSNLFAAKLSLNTMASEIIEQRYSSVEVEYTFTKSTFSKRIVPVEDRPLDIYGREIHSFLIHARLRNEYDALQFIGEKTTIRVPKVLSYSAEENKLTVERMDGISLDEVKEEDRPMAMAKTERYLKEDVLPQLRNLKSRLLGQLQGVVIPPPWLHQHEPRLDWPRRQARGAETFIYCHNDLGQQNILLDPATLEVKAVIDWEYSGFFPPNFERPLWRKPSRQFSIWIDPIQLTRMRNQLLAGKTAGSATPTLYVKANIRPRTQLLLDSFEQGVGLQRRTNHQSTPPGAAAMVVARAVVVKARVVLGLAISTRQICLGDSYCNGMVMFSGLVQSDSSKSCT